MLLGLIKPSAGEAAVLGEPISSPPRYLGRVGALVENPAFVPSLSARAHLTSLARLRGLPRARVDAVLQTVGLTGRDREPVKRFSLGMKQRLGISAALLPDPALLILDEPTNGLDPSGIVEIRSLLAQLGTAGRTVVVSSHLLSEIEAICEQLLVIRFGELLYSGPITGLLGAAGQHVDLRTEHDADTDRLVEILRTQGWEVVSSTVGVIRVSAGAQDAAPINRAAQAAGITLRSLTDCLTQLATLRADILPFELAMITDPELVRVATAAHAAEPGPPEFLAQYLHAEQQLGRIRADIDPGKIAVVLLATLFGLAVPPQRTIDALGDRWPAIADGARIVIEGIGATPPLN